MLATAFDRLTTLVSKQFLIGVFVPVLVFGFVNGTLLFLEFDWFRQWAGPQISVAARAFDATAVLVGLAIVAFVLWSLNAFLREVLEGRHLRPHSWLGKRFVATQYRRRSKLEIERSKALRQRAGIERERVEWRQRLREAATTGTTEHPGKTDYGAEGTAAREIEELLGARATGWTTELTRLVAAVQTLEIALRENDVREPAPGQTESLLRAHYLVLLDLIDYAMDDWAGREVQAAMRLQESFGSGAVAPTSFGNVARSVQGYTMSRYRLDLNTFWSRMQPVLGKHADFYAGLQDHKAQLDFLVTSIWLGVVTWCGWLIALPALGHSRTAFLVVAFVGPILTTGLYGTAIEKYKVFCGVVRTAVDLYRFELLDAIHVTRPPGLRDERALWETLRGVSSFGVEWADLSYDFHAEDAH